MLASNLLKALSDLEWSLSARDSIHERPCRKIPFSAICQALALSQRNCRTIEREELGDSFPEWHDIIVATMISGMNQPCPTLQFMIDSVPWADPDDVTMWFFALLENGLFETVGVDQLQIRMSPKLLRVFQIMMSI
jgi:hypothetical protein